MGFNVKIDMVKRALVAATALVVLAAVAGSCRNADDKVFMDPSVDLSRTQNLTDNARPGMKNPVPIALASYRVRVFGKTGLTEICSGAVDLQLMSNLGFGPANGGMMCLNQKIDLGRLLAGLSGTAETDDTDMIADGTMVRVRRFGGISFNPARPLVVGPVVQNPAMFMNLNQTSQHMATWQNPANGRVVNSVGNTTVRVLGVNQTFESTTLNKTFDRILHWEMTSTGYDGIPKSDAFIFDRIEMLWNSRPLVVPKIVVEGSIRDFLSGDSRQPIEILAEVFVGRVKIVLEATRFEGL